MFSDLCELIAKEYGLCRKFSARVLYPLLNEMDTKHEVFVYFYTDEQKLQSIVTPIIENLIKYTNLISLEEENNYEYSEFYRAGHESQIREKLKEQDHLQIILLDMYRKGLVPRGDYCIYLLD